MTSAGNEQRQQSVSTLFSSVSTLFSGTLLSRYSDLLRRRMAGNPWK
jgi:hypothetical protein